MKASTSSRTRTNPWWFRFHWKYKPPTPTFLMQANLSVLLLLLVSFCSIHPCSSFVVIVSSDEDPTLFDAKIAFNHHLHNNHRSDSRNDDYGDQATNYQYRVSHHKTQPWIHRLVHFDANHEGKLRFRRHYSHSQQCQETSTGAGGGSVAPALPSTFLVYIDIIKKIGRAHV